MVAAPLASQPPPEAGKNGLQFEYINVLTLQWVPEHNLPIPPPRFYLPSWPHSRVAHHACSKSDVAPSEDGAAVKELHGRLVEPNFWGHIVDGFQGDAKSMMQLLMTIFAH